MNDRFVAESPVLVGIRDVVAGERLGKTGVG
jgi:hypothetical protein